MKKFIPNLLFILSAVFFPRIKILTTINIAELTPDKMEEGKKKLKTNLSNQRSQENFNKLFARFPKSYYHAAQEIVVCKIKPLKWITRAYLQKFIKFSGLRCVNLPDLFPLGLNNLPSILKEDSKLVIIYDDNENSEIPILSIDSKKTKEGYYLEPSYMDLNLIKHSEYGRGESIEGTFVFARA